MIDPQHFERVRIVQDLSLETTAAVDPKACGTKVVTDVFAASPDSLFPLQGALGYELHQTLFIGPNSLVVEGVSDLMYLQVMSDQLQKKGYTGLEPRWTITPVGGALKVPAFVALLGSQKGMNIAMLIDYQHSNKQKIEAIYKDKLLRKANIFTFSDFTKTDEADIEDMFGDEFYIELVNAEFGAQLSVPVDAAKLTLKKPRILERIEHYIVEHPLKEGRFSHYRPSRYFSENIKSLEKKIPKAAVDRFKSAVDALNALLPKQ